MTYVKQRAQMLREIEAEVRSTSRWIGKSVLDKRVMDAMNHVPRHEFVPADMIHLAYQNEPLPIGFGQTISQPYIVALMTDMLELRDSDVVLEIGTGCGYQTAVISELVKQVYTVEVIRQLGGQAKERLTQLGYRNIGFRRTRTLRCHYRHGGRRSDPRKADRAAQTWRTHGNTGRHPAPWSDITACSQERKRRH